MNNHKSFVVMLIAASLTCAPLANAHMMISAVNHRLVQQDGADPSTAEQEMFLQAQRLYEKSQFDQSVRVLQELLTKYPQSSITDLTLLWLARSYIGLNNLREAERIGGQLRQIKDTPFLEIYQMELADARRKGGVLVADNSIGGATTPAGTDRPRVAVNIEPAPRRSLPSQEPGTSPTPRLITSDPSPEIKLPSTGSQASRNTDSSGAPASRRGSRRGDLSGARRITRVEPDGTTTTMNVPSVASNIRGASGRDGRTSGGSRRATNDSSSPMPSTPPVRNDASLDSAEPAAQGATGDPAYELPVAMPDQGGSGGGAVFTVKQVPSLSLALRNNALGASPGQAVSLPFVITNTGNKEDQFRIETDLPAEYQPTFSTSQGASDTGLPILVTPQVPRGGTYEMQLNLRIPESVGDGQQRRFLVRAASQFDTQVERVADASLNVVAAALAAASAVSQPTVQPSETFSQTIQVRNQGSATARAARAEFVFDPDFELVSASPSPLVYDRSSRTAVWSLGEMSARDTRDITVNLRSVGDALAASKPLGRGTLRTSSLPTPSNFDGPSVTVGRVTRARVDSVSAGLTTTPGDTIFVPFVVRNPGNYPESFELRITAPGAPVAAIFADTNGDGQHQEGEPAVTQTAPVAPRGGQYPILLRIEIPRTMADRQQFGYSIVARSLTNSRVANEGNTVLTVAAPRVRIRPEQADSTEVSGDLIFYRLVLVNEGSGLARNLVVTEQLPSELQFVNSDPTLSPQDAPGASQRLTWRVPDLAPGDTAVLRIAVRLRPGLNANVTVQTRPSLVYQDGNGNSYRGQ